MKLAVQNLPVINDIVPLYSLEVLFQNLVGALLGAAGIIFFFMLIVGGFKYITSAGDPKSAAAARSTLTTAILGLVLVASSVLIIRIIEEFTGATLSTFLIYVP